MIIICLNRRCPVRTTNHTEQQMWMHDSKTRGKFKARLTRIQVGTQKVKNSQAEESKKRGKRLGRKTGSGSQQKATRETLRNKAQEEPGIHERKHTKYSKTKETQMQHIRVGQVITQEGNTEEQEDEPERDKRVSIKIKQEIQD